MNSAQKKIIDNFFDPLNNSGLFSKNPDTANITRLISENIGDKDLILYFLDKIEEKMHNPSIEKRTKFVDIAIDLMDIVIQNIIDEFSTLLIEWEDSNLFGKFLKAPKMIRKRDQIVNFLSDSEIIIDKAIGIFVPLDKEYGLKDSDSEIRRKLCESFYKIVSNGDIKKYSDKWINVIDTKNVFFSTIFKKILETDILENEDSYIWLMGIDVLSNSFWMADSNSRIKFLRFLISENTGICDPHPDVEGQSYSSIILISDIYSNKINPSKNETNEIFELAWENLIDIPDYDRNISGLKLISALNPNTRYKEDAIDYMVEWKKNLNCEKENDLRIFNEITTTLKNWNDKGWIPMSKQGLINEIFQKRKIDFENVDLNNKIKM